MGRLWIFCLTAVSALSLSAAYPAPGMAADAPASSPAPAQVQAQAPEALTPAPAALDKPLSLEDCVAVALGGHPKVKGAEADLRAGEWMTRAAEAAFWPQIGFEASRNYTHSERVIRVGGASVNTTSAYIANNFTLNTNWMLFDFGRTYYNVKGLARGEDSLRHDLTAAEQRVAYDVMDAYYGLLKAKSLVGVAQETLDASKDHLKQSQAFFESGVKPRFDVTTAEVEVNNAVVQVIKSMDGVKAARATLNTKLGLDPLAPTEIQERPRLEELSMTAEACLDEAIKNRPEIQSLMERLNSGDMAVKAAYAGFMPQLSAAISQSWYKEDHTDTFPNRNFQLTLDVPVFSGFNTTASVGAARATALSIKYKIEDLKRDVQQQVSVAYLSVEDAKARIDALESSVQKARENLDIAKGRYEAGVGAFIEVTDAQVSLTTAETDKAQATYDYHLAYSSLMRGVGKDVK